MLLFLFNGIILNCNLLLGNSTILIKKDDYINLIKINPPSVHNSEVNDDYNYYFSIDLDLDLLSFRSTRLEKYEFKILNLGNIF